jgi:T5orf172 domain
MRILTKGNYTADWIPDYLQPATQNALRVEMQKARAASDVEGYIYTFEILGMGPILSTKLPHPAYLIESTARTDPADKKTIHLKVGRATNLNRRMDQWGKQCGSKEQILRGFWPGGMDKAGVPMKGLVQAGPKGPWCHRVERLVHIELTDLVEHTPYLDERYPNVAANKEVKKGSKKDVKRCPDCMCPSHISTQLGSQRNNFYKVIRSIKRSSRLSE